MLKELKDTRSESVELQASELNIKQDGDNIKFTESKFRYFKKPAEIFNAFSREQLSGIGEVVLSGAVGGYFIYHLIEPLKVALQTHILDNPFQTIAEIAAVALGAVGAVRGSQRWNKGRTAEDYANNHARFD